MIRRPKNLHGLSTDALFRLAVTLEAVNRQHVKRLRKADLDFDADLQLALDVDQVLLSRGIDPG